MTIPIPPADAVRDDGDAAMLQAAVIVRANAEHWIATHDGGHPTAEGVILNLIKSNRSLAGRVVRPAAPFDEAAFEALAIPVSGSTDVGFTSAFHLGARAMKERAAAFLAARASTTAGGATPNTVREETDFTAERERSIRQGARGIRRAPTSPARNGGAGRDFDARPYEPEEARVAEYLSEQFGLGGGDDPIGFLITHDRWLIYQQSGQAERDSPDELREAAGALLKAAQPFAERAQYWDKYGQHPLEDEATVCLSDREGTLGTQWDHEVGEFRRIDEAYEALRRAMAGKEGEK